MNFCGTAVSCAGGVSGGPWSACEWPGEANCASFGGARKPVPVFSTRSFSFASRALPIVGRCVLVTLNTPYTPSLDVTLTLLRWRCSLVPQRSRATAESVRRGTSGSPALLWHLWRRRVVERGSTAPSRTLAAPRTRRSGLRPSSRSNGRTPRSPGARASRPRPRRRRKATHTRRCRRSHDAPTAARRRRAPPRDERAALPERHTPHAATYQRLA